MKRNDLNEIKRIDVKAISIKIKETKKELQGLVLDNSLNKLKDKKSIFKKRKDLAQMLTVFNQKRLLESLEKGVAKDAKK